MSGALKKLKTGKATGLNNVNIEVIKLIEQDQLCSLKRLMNILYNTEDWLKSVFGTLPRKSKARRCKENRTISFMSQLLFTIIH